ncbi:MAG: hypothetical protein RIR34_341 [Actinomycetota bacterium]|jgi:hypothetical protein
MNKNSMRLLVALSFLFALQHAAYGFISLEDYTSTVTPIIAVVAYLCAVTMSIFGHKTLQLPTWQAVINLLVAIALPLLVLSQFPIEIADSSGSFDTWFVGALSALLAITTIRGHAVIGWIGLVVLWIEVIAWGGPAVIVTTGLIGALIYVGAADGMGRGLRSLVSQTEVQLAKAVEIATNTARKTAGRAERERLIQSTLLTGIPELERIVASNGQITEADRREIALLEARFRDEIQGNALLNDAVRFEAREARQRGVTVSFVDGGGLDDADDSARESIHQSIASAIRSTQAGNIVIRSPRGESYQVSIIATRPEALGPDLWLRLP